MTQDKVEIPELYRRILDAMKSAGPVDPRMTSGFVATEEPESHSLRKWRPVGAYPEQMVGGTGTGDASLWRIGDKAILGLRAGGGFPEWAWKAYAGTTQYIDVILNGNTLVEVAHDYDGRDGWAYQELTLPDSSTFDIFACEIEKDGKLLFSDYVQQENVAADRININYLTGDGNLVGWATNNSEPTVDVFFEISINGKVQIVRSQSAWPDSPYRKFTIPLGLEHGETYKICAQTLAGGEADRSPVYGLHAHPVGIILANPHVDSDGAHVTVVGNFQSENRPLTFVPEDTNNPSRYQASDPDTAPYFYLDGMNTVTLPTKYAQKKCAFKVLAADGRFLFSIPNISAIFGNQT